MNYSNKNELILNLDNLHTTDLGVVRIKRNLSLDEDDIVKIHKFLNVTELCST